jgi:hypothetical protein
MFFSEEYLEICFIGNRCEIVKKTIGESGDEVVAEILGCNPSTLA